MGVNQHGLRKRRVSPSRPNAMWPAPQRAGHTTQLITTNEEEQTTAGSNENAFATKCLELAPKRGRRRVEAWTFDAADIVREHELCLKVTGIL